MDNDRIEQKSKRAEEQKNNKVGKQKTSQFLLLIFCFFVFLFSVSCAHTGIKREVQIPEEFRAVKPERHVPQPPQIPEFVPVTEEVSPLKIRIIDIVARNTPLRDVLHVIAEVTGLNLVMEKGVYPELPITVTLRNVSAADALNTIFTSVDYFYEIRNNLLIVKAVDTRIFELGHPAIMQTYGVDVGGDILGGVAAVGHVRGAIVQSIEGDPAATNFWDVVEKSIANIMGIGAGMQAAQQNFTINRITGTIVVTATKSTLKKVEQYLDTVRRVINRQVLIEAKIIEVQLSEGFKYGIDWRFLDHWRGVGEIAFGTQGFSGVVPPGEPFFSLGVTGTNFSLLLKALRQQGEVRTLSNPRVNIMNGQSALLSVGRNVSFISRVTTTAVAGAVPPVVTHAIETDSILSGLIIGIVPFITEYGEISLTITPIVSDLVRLEDKRFGQAGRDEIQISLPTIDLRQLSTTVKVRDRQMVIIGGLISKREHQEDDRVPILSDVPVLGGLFKRRTVSETRSELIVVLQPALVSR